MSSIVLHDYVKWFRNMIEFSWILFFTMMSFLVSWLSVRWRYMINSNHKTYCSDFYTKWKCKMLNSSSIWTGHYRLHRLGLAFTFHAKKNSENSAIPILYRVGQRKFQSTPCRYFGVLFKCVKNLLCVST